MMGIILDRNQLAQVYARVLGELLHSPSAAPSEKLDCAAECDLCGLDCHDLCGFYCRCVTLSLRFRRGLGVKGCNAGTDLDVPLTSSRCQAPSLGYLELHVTVLPSKS